MLWIGMVIGIIIGGMLGLIVSASMATARKGDDQ